MKIESWPLSRLTPYEKNPRKNDVAIDAVARSIEAFGFRVPIVVDKEGVIIAGHTRLKAAQKLGFESAPVHIASELTLDQAAALRIADNKLAELATWDMELLPIELGDLRGVNFDLSLMGFDEQELSVIFAPSGTEGLTDEDDVPAPPDAATTQRGDIWILGEHRLLCGDSGSAADVDRLLEGNPVHLVNTDPPYNVNVEPRSNNAIAAGNSSFSAGKGKATGAKLRAKDRPLVNDFVTDAVFDELLVSWFGEISRVLIPGGGFYIWGGYANLGNYPGPLKESGLYFSQGIVWDKQHPVLTRKDFMGAFEICFYGWKEGAAHRWLGPTNATDLWHIKKVNPQSMVHLTEKPVELAKRAIEYSSNAGERVLDLFGGSGSTLIACEVLGRRCVTMELDALYCDVIVQRWESFTGKKAERVGKTVVSSFSGE